MDSRLQVIKYQQDNSIWFNISYHIPATYQEGLQMVRDAGGIKIHPQNVWSLPLRHNPQDSYEEGELEKQGVDRVYFSSRQCDGIEGGIAQMLMQPEGVTFEKTFVALTLENLRLNPLDSISSLYARAEEFGLKKCPITTVIAMSLIGIETGPWDNFVFMSDPFKYNGLNRLYVLTRHGRKDNPPQLIFGYGHPKTQIQEIGNEWSMTIFQKTGNGFKQTAGSDERRFHWRFVFELPENHHLKNKLLKMERHLVTA